MSDVVFQTSRLSGRRLSPDDVDALFAVYSDPETVRWVGDGTPLTREKCEEWLEVTAANYERRGYGMFALVERESKAVYGFAGLVHPRGQEECEIKYALHKSHWGRGYATEAVRALLAYGKSEHGIHRIIATVADQNTASRHVLEKVGMAVREVREHSKGSTLVYEWSTTEATDR